jgi:hypothetical protein
MIILEILKEYKNVINTTFSFINISDFIINNNLDLIENKRKLKFLLNNTNIDLNTLPPQILWYINKLISEEEELYVREISDYGTTRF